MQLELKATILGNPLILVNAAKRHAPAEVYRLGSVLLKFMNPERLETIRVYGFLENLALIEQRREFEKLLRAHCESEPVIEALFGKGIVVQRAVRFNPALQLTRNGWRDKINPFGYVPV